MLCVNDLFNNDWWWGTVYKHSFSTDTDEINSYDML